jgi:hypothetical protein
MATMNHIEMFLSAQNVHWILISALLVQRDEVLRQMHLNDVE